MKDFLDACVVCLAFAAIVASVTGHNDAKGLLAAAIIAVLFRLAIGGGKDGNKWTTDNDKH